MLTPLMNNGQSIEAMLDEHGLGVSLVIRRRVFPPDMLRKVERYLPKMSEVEIELLFLQCQYDNIKVLSYAEEEVALKQAAICEVLEVMKKLYSGS
jgi:hypothetical protein